MAIYSLAVFADDMSVELFSSRKAAEDSFMRDLHVNYKGCGFPDEYDETEISDHIGAIGESLIWSITKHLGYTDSPAIITA